MLERVVVMVRVRLRLLWAPSLAIMSGPMLGATDWICRNHTEEERLMGGALLASKHEVILCVYNAYSRRRWLRITGPFSCVCLCKALFRETEANLLYREAVNGAVFCSWCCAG